MKPRRRFLDSIGRFGLAGAVAPLVSACAGLRPARPSPPAPSEHYDLVVIGTGFGGTLTALSIAYAMDERLARKPSEPPLRVLMLERGTWWTTPTETMQDKQVKTRDFLIRRGQPTQEWSSLADYRGMFDLLRRCRYSPQRPQGLYDFAPIGKRGLFNLQNDGVSVLRASGVGGGSLIYSKILIRPPETLFDDPRWPGAWRGRAGAELRNAWYRRAVTGITVGVEALTSRDPALFTGMTGLSNIVTRAPGFVPAVVPAPRNLGIPPTDGQRPLLQIRIADKVTLKEREPELIDRARIFQTAMAQLTPHYGTVDLSINDMEWRPGAQGSALKQRAGTNVCERHGRCNVGCLPGAGQTLNKQLMRAIYGKVATGGIDRTPAGDGECVMRRVSLQLRTLADAEVLSAAPEGGYRVHYRQRFMAEPAATPEDVVVSADRVIVAAGSLGSAELMLRSRQRHADSGGAEGLPRLSERLGAGFSPNGDHIALLADTRERVNLNYGPVTTSFGQFGVAAPQARGFHNIEDQGIPRALSALAGHGFDAVRKLASDDGVERYVQALSSALKALQEVFARSPQRTYAAAGPADLSADRPEAEDELAARMMCIVAQGKDDANGQFRLEGGRLRVARTDGKAFHDDPIYAEIRRSLARLAAQLRAEGTAGEFISPLVDAVPPGMKPTVLTSHPLGGCPMGDSVATGVVDEWGRVYRQDAKPAFHRGLYIADGSVIPTALGVNPSLTISAVALRAAEKILAEWDEIPARARRGPAALQCRPAPGTSA